MHPRQNFALGAFCLVSPQLIGYHSNNFQKVKVAMNPTYIIFLNLPKIVFVFMYAYQIVIKKYMVPFFFFNYNPLKLSLKTQYCPLSIARCDLLAAIFAMLKVLRLLFVARIELLKNNGRFAPVKTKTTTEAQRA